MSTTILLLCGLPCVIAALVLPLRGPAAGRLALLGPLAVLALGATLWPEVGGPVERVAWTWLDSVGVPLSFRVDRLGVFFVLLVGGVGLAVFQYARHYLGEAATSGFWAAMLAFTAGMLWIVLADSLVVLICGWELTTVASALLIGMDSANPEARRGAIQALLVTGAGGLALLVGVVLLGVLGGSWELSGLAARADALVADPRHVVPLVLLLVAAFTKSAQVPFHFWLPGAMAAPAPVSAYLHSATMVKAGIFLLARLVPVFGSSPVWTPTLAVVGLATFVWAGWSAVRAYDTKELLAWSTVSYLGLLTASYGWYPEVGSAGELVAIANHALYKSSFFLLLGWVERVARTRDLRALGPTRWLGFSPLASTLLVVAASAMAGMPLLVGYAGKEVAIGAIGGGALERWGLPTIALFVGSVFAVAQALKLSATVLSGTAPPSAPPRPPAWLLVVPAALLLVQVVGGVAPAAVLGALEPDRAWGPSVWTKLDAKLAFSVGTLLLGGGLWIGWQRVAALPASPSAERVAGAVGRAALAGSARASAILQGGGHAAFVSAVLASAVAVVAGAALWAPPLAAPAPDLTAEAVLWAVPAVAILVGAPAAVVLPGRIAKLVLLAAVGYGMAILYVLLRAPDLALTQLLVETIGLLLLLLLFRHLPRLGPDRRGRVRRVAHGALALAVGGAMSALACVAAVSHPARPVGDAQLALSRPLADGDNVVNVILVDFRGLDTLGEIAVLAIAAVGATAVLGSRADGEVTA